MEQENINTEIVVKDTSVRVIRVKNVDYISLTDLARYQNSKDPSFIIKNWLRKISTIDYIGLWEQLHNLNFNLVEFDQIKTEYGKNSFTMSPSQWIKRTKAIGIIAKAGKYSLGTFAHPDIAFEFASWISPEFKLYLITEFERLKVNESYQNKIHWSVRRELAKTNYKIHTDSIKYNIVPNLTEKQKQYVYANEAELLNVALFGMSSKEWRNNNPNLQGNMRDYADIIQLIILSNLENLNAEMVEQGLPQSKRLERLNSIAQNQYNSLKENKSIKKIEKLDYEYNLKLNNSNF